MSAPVVLFGAGATCACGGPLTRDILPGAFDGFRQDPDNELFGREDYIVLLKEFLEEHFHLDPLGADGPDDFPPLPLLLSLIDTAIDRKEPFGRAWPRERLQDLRRAAEYLIFALLEHRLRQLRHNYYRDFLEGLQQACPEEPTILTLNYDIIVDNAMLQRNEERHIAAIPDYRCDLVYSHPMQPERRGVLIKLHGSLNWFYCPGCHRLSLAISQGMASTYKATADLFIEDQSLERSYSCHGRPCVACGVDVQPVLITPTHLKDYRNPHIARLWYEAEQRLREAERVIIVGYSLPEDDLEVAYLLKRGMLGGPPKRLTVVEHDPAGRPQREHPVGRRYRHLFGDVDWHTGGLEGWLRAPDW